MQFVHRVAAKKSILKPDAALGLTFTAFFAFGILLIAIYGTNAHMDADCMLYGEIGLVPLADKLSIAGVDLGAAHRVNVRSNPSGRRLGYSFLQAVDGHQFRFYPG